MKKTIFGNIKKNTSLGESIIQYYSGHNISLGFCYNNCISDTLKKVFKIDKSYELIQIHSNDIFHSDQIGDHEKGDGIIITKPGEAAIIRTADCIPLFFYSSAVSIAGIIHAGWRGFHAGIEKKLISKLRELNIDIKKLFFVAGPHIEGKCYNVGTDLFDKFKGKENFDKFFIEKRGKLYMDIFKGLKLSLINEGIPKRNISSMELCTFCSDKRLPSYRLNKTSRRICNFIFLKNKHLLR